MYKNRITNYRSSSKFQRNANIGPIVKRSFLDGYELRISESPMKMYHGSKTEFEQFKIGDYIYTYDIIFTSLKKGERLGVHSIQANLTYVSGRLIVSLKIKLS